MTIVPKLPYVIFGDLFEARCHEITENIVDEEGNEKIRLKLEPTPATMKQFNIKYPDLDPQDMTITKEYNDLDVVVINQSISNPRLLLSCDWNGRSTKLKDKLYHKWRTAAENAIREKNATRIYNKRLEEMIIKAISNPEEMRAKFMAEVREIKKVIGSEIIKELPEDDDING